MPLSRRPSSRPSANIWPGFVDAVTSLLMVMTFVLTIFIVVQFVLREEITGQKSRLDELASEVSDLSAALGLSSQRAEGLESERDALSAERDRQDALIAALQEAEAEATSRIASFEEQVASLLTARDRDSARIADLEAETAELSDAGEAARLALAQARQEIDAQDEAARLAAARREALEALVADLRSETAETEARATELEARLTEEEAARLADAAAADALRKRLEGSGAELTALSLTLEEERRKAEETLTLLAAAEAAEADLRARLDRLARDLRTTEAERDAQGATEAELRARLAKALAAQADAETSLTEAEQRAILLAQAQTQLSEVSEVSASQQREIAALNVQVARLRQQIGTLQSLLDLAEDKDVEAQTQIESLSQKLNTALARQAIEQKRRAELEAAERERLENYRSEFFGRLREVLADREGVRIVGDRFVFDSNVLFPSGSAVLSGDGRESVAQVAQLLKDIADEIPEAIDWVIRVDGHTDNVPLSGDGRFADNWELSQERALSVVRYMAEDLGFDATRLVPAGFGEFRPVDPADTDEARARNRRIEMKLTER
ncbi:peptidoglycan -binding protein [Palleronia caenipelagi]|uniref:Peptidoglycan-binding protein n=1 Tax=Palleronia caenipelagi TaxID=2489174 RepID=A0A547Q9L0_9RHOB|nr:peptidoglycan -binding protein [Palleronia caenipelagi]TRD23077.1 peptidoglycan -binding protein [Palleronia caenipelagi]